MMEVYVLVPVKKTFFQTFMGVLMLVLTITTLLMTCVSLAAGPFVIVFGALCYVFMFHSSKEFEYSYFDGEVRFARVMNKSRRKGLGTYSMDEVVQIAPAGDRSITRFEGDSSVKVLDYTSHEKEKPYYGMVIQKEGTTLLIKMEPDEEYLGAIEQKYKSKLIRRNA